MADWKEHLKQDRRLVILRALDEERDGRLNDSLLEQALSLVGHDVPRETVQSDLVSLEAIEAVRLDSFGEVMIAEITRKGADHVARKIKLPGVKVPARR